MSSDRALRVGAFHLPIIGLEVTQAWRVGRVTFRPSGWSREVILRDLERRWGERAGRVELERERLDGLKWATAVVRARDHDAARAMTRASVDVLRFFQQRHWLYVDTDRQTFGLGDSIQGSVTEYWVTDRAVGPLGGMSRHGVFADWKMLPEHHGIFRQDPLYRFLCEALVADHRTPLQARALTTLRSLGADSLTLPSPARVVIFAVAIEGLLGEGQKAEGDKGHRLVRRAAYLTCGTDSFPYHGPERGSCIYMAANDKGDLLRRQDLRIRKGLGAICSTYEAIRELFAARNQAAHSGAADPSERDLGRWRFMAEGIVERGLRCGAANGQLPVDALDAEIASWPTLD